MALGVGTHEARRDARMRLQAAASAELFSLERERWEGEDEEPIAIP